MSPAILNVIRFYRYLFELDQMIAAELQAASCPDCGGKLHVGDYPRKPRDLRSVLDETYQLVWSRGSKITLLLNRTRTLYANKSAS